MKRLLNKLLLVIMSLILVVSVVGCKKNNNTSVAEKPTEGTLPTITNPIVAAGDVNLAPALDLLSPVLGNPYTNITLDASASVEVEGHVNGATLKGTINIKMTGAGYDVLANVSASQLMDGQVVETTSLKFWYVNGLVVIGLPWDGGWEYGKLEVGNFNDLVSTFNQMIAYSPEYMEYYTAFMPMVEELTRAIKESEIIGTSIDETIDLKVIYDQVLGHVLDNSEMSLFDYVLTYVLAIDPTDEEAVAALKAEILALFEDDPTIANILDGLVAAINEYLPEDQQITLEEIFDLIQAKMGMTTAEIVEMINYEYIMEEESYLPAPEEGISFYEYAYSMFHAIKVSDLVAMTGEFETLEELYDTLVYMASDYTFGDAINEALSSYFGGEYEYVYTPNEGDYEYNEEEDWYDYVGEGNGDYSYAYVDVDYIEEIRAINPTIDNFTVNVKYSPDSKGRLGELNLSTSADFAFTEEGIRQAVAQDASLKLKFTYTKPSTSFSIPTDVLKQAVEME